MIRLYPTAEQEALLRVLEDYLRRVWNEIFISPTENVIRAREAYAVRNGLVGPRPVRPNYEGMDPEAAKAAKQAHYEACGAWAQAVHKATDKDPACSWRGGLKEEMRRWGCKQDYQMLRQWVRPPEEITPCAHLLMALVKNFFSGKAKDGKGRAKGQRRKQFRRATDPMPLQVRSRDCFELGNFGDRRGKPYYDCQVSINGLKIRGRLPGKKPEGRVLEGVSLTKQADGWWASIKQEVPVRQLPPAVPSTMAGIDVGLNILAAIAVSSDPEVPCIRVANPREKYYAGQIALLQSQGKDTSRLQQRAARNVKHLIYNQIVKPLATFEVIKVEKLNGKIGQMGSRMTSSMRTATRILKERYCTRVREVECAFTSQDCSQCGHRSKESWAYDRGPIGKCPKCGHREHRDDNASRNIRAKEPIPLET